VVPFVLAKAVPDTPTLEQLGESASEIGAVDALTETLPALSAEQSTAGEPWLTPLPPLLVTEGRSEGVWWFPSGEVVRLALRYYFFTGATVIAVGLLIGSMLSRRRLSDR
jgi:hypothetical protein